MNCFETSDNHGVRMSVDKFHILWNYRKKNIRTNVTWVTCPLKDNDIDPSW